MKHATKDTPWREPIFSGPPDVNLELPGADVRYGRLITLEHLPANPTTESGH